MAKEFEYIPDLDKLFGIYRDMVGALYHDDMGADPYFSFLVDNGLLILDETELKPENSGMIAGESDGPVHVVNEAGILNPSDRDSMRRSFRVWIQNVDVVKEILTHIGEGLMASTEELVEALKDTYSTNEVLVYLAWLERLNQIRMRNGKYEIIDEEVADAEDMEYSDGIYPFSYTAGAVDIEEAKYSVFEYLRKLQRGDIMMNPEFQRNQVWKNDQKSRFVESLLLQLPIPQLYLKRDNVGKFVVIDGLQRTTALADFIDNRFVLTGLNALSDLNGKSFRDLQEDASGLSTRIEDKQLLFYILGPSVPMRVVYDIFNRINTGGTKLERQEVRNCVFIGPSTRLLKDISESVEFRSSIENGISDKRMKDREAILRCLAFALTPYEEYQGSLDEFLEMTMKNLNSLSSVEIEFIKQRAIATFRRTHEIFGNRNFRIPSGHTRGRVNIAVMEAVFNCFWDRSDDKISDNDILVQRFNELIRDGEFLDSFRSSTGSKYGVRTRFSKAHKYLDYYIDYD